MSVMTTHGIDIYPDVTMNKLATAESSTHGNIGGCIFIPHIPGIMSNQEYLIDRKPIISILTDKQESKCKNTSMEMVLSSMRGARCSVLSVRMPISMAMDFW